MKFLEQFFVQFLEMLLNVRRILKTVFRRGAGDFFFLTFEPSVHSFGVN